MKLLVLTDNFPPETNAPAIRTYAHCREWVRLGAEVTVITCAPNFPQGEVYDGYKNRLYSVEVVDGIKVIRVWSYITANEGFFKRILDFISFAVTAFFAGLFVKTDVILATSPQFFTAVTGRILSLIKRKPWIMEVRDLWPESIVAVGAMKEGFIYDILTNVEMHLYRSAERIVVVTDTFKEKLITRGVESDKIDVIKNGADMSLFPGQTSPDLVLKEKLGLENKFIISYIGTHGMAHALDFILKCAKALEENPAYHFLFIGTGAEKDNLIALKNRLQVRNVTMLPPVAREEVVSYLSITDVALINLRKSNLFTSVLPSKIFESAAMGLPILIGVNGEARLLVESYGAGLGFEPENLDDFMSKLALVSTPESYSKYQQGALCLAEDFDRKKLAQLMLEKSLQRAI